MTQKQKSNKTGKSPFLIKMLLTTYLLICVPMIVAQVLLLNSSVRELSTRNDTYYDAETKNLSSRMADQIEEFRADVMKISSKSWVSFIRRFSDLDVSEQMMTEVAKEVSQYPFKLQIAQDIGVYYMDRQIFLNKQYYYQLENFCNKFANGDPETYNRIYSLFTEPFEEEYRIVSSLRQSTSEGAEMLVAVPARLNRRIGDYDAIFYFTVTKTTMNALLTEPFPENNSYAFFDPSGELLFTNSRTNLQNLFSKEFQAFLRSENENKYIFADNNCTVYKYSEPDSPYTFVSIVGKSRFEENNAAFLRTMRILLFCNIFLAAVLVAITAYINYHPLRKLVSKLVPHEKKPSSELEQIENAITELGNRTTDQSMVIMDYVLTDLLYGTSVRHQQLTDLVPNFDCCNFCAVSVPCSRPTTEQSRRISEQILKSSRYQIFITDLPNRNYNLFVCLSKQEIDRELLSASITAAVKQVLQETCRVYVGTVVSNLDDIVLSYYASQAEAGGQSAFVYTKDYPSSEIQLFSRQIETGKLPAARQTLQSICDFSLKNTHNRVLCRYVNYETLITYVSARKRTNCPIADAELKNLLSFTNTDHLHKEIEASIDTMERRIAQEGADETTVLQDEIVEFINQNFFKTDISLISVADRFGISIYMLSRVFKSRTGIGFKEYITAKRLDLACRLLLTTSDNISVIAQNCGFENPTYFTSIFKVHYGMTPSKFRESAV